METVGWRFGRIESAASRPDTDDSWAEEVRDQTIELRTATAAGAAAIAALGGGSGADLITDSASYNTATVIRLYDDVLQLVDELAQATDRSGFPAQFSYPLQKSDSDTECKFAVLLEREADKWLKPVKGQFQMFYKLGAEQPEYVPDFVAETALHVLMVETKVSKDLGSTEAKAKAQGPRRKLVHCGAST